MLAPILTRTLPEGAGTASHTHNTHTHTLSLSLSLTHSLSLSLSLKKVLAQRAQRGALHSIMVEYVLLRDVNDSLEVW